MMSSNRRILVLENDTERFEEVLKPLKVLPSTALANIGEVFNAFDLDDESPVHVAPLKDLCT